MKANNEKAKAPTQTREERKAEWIKPEGTQDKLQQAAGKYGVKKEEPKTIAKKETTREGYKKLRKGYATGGKSSRDNFWYRKIDKVDLTKGTINDDGSITFSKPQFDISRIMVWDRKDNDNDRIICHLWIELSNGIMLKGFKVWNSEDGDGSIYMTESQFSYIKRDEKETDSNGNPKRTWTGHIDTKKAREFTALCLCCIECVLEDDFDDEACNNEDEE